MQVVVAMVGIADERNHRLVAQLWIEVYFFPFQGASTIMVAFVMLFYRVFEPQNGFCDELICAFDVVKRKVLCNIIRRRITAVDTEV